MTNNAQSKLELLIQQQGAEKTAKAVDNLKKEINATGQAVFRLTAGTKVLAQQLGMVGLSTTSNRGKGILSAKAYEKTWADIYRGLENIDKKKRTFKQTTLGLDNIMPIPKSKMISGRFDDITTSMKKWVASAKKVSLSARQMNSGFTMANLGIMFFGMMIQRFFVNLATISLKTFKDIAGSTSYLTQGIAKLEAAWTFLKFSVGNAIATALLPLIPRIMEIVMAIGEWINRNPKLVAEIIKWGAIIGAALFLLGSFALGLNSLRSLFILMIGEKLGALLFGPLIIGLLTLIALIFVWKSDTLDTMDKIIISIGIVSVALLLLAATFMSLPIFAVAAFGLILTGFAALLQAWGYGADAFGSKWKFFTNNMYYDFIGALNKMSPGFVKWIENLWDSLPAWAKKWFAYLGFIGGSSGMVAAKIIEVIGRGRDEAYANMQDAALAFDNAVSNFNEKTILGSLLSGTLVSDLNNKLTPLQKELLEAQGYSAADNLNMVDQRESLASLKEATQQNTDYMGRLTEELKKNTETLSSATGLEFGGGERVNVENIEIKLDSSANVNLAEEIARQIKDALSRFISG